ncbi:MAG TPA: twin-arginine translocase TatA/TatE family subunit [Anaerolineales bacterium]|nr:twin-arginine translocase TatA/TatE family subunit [Anaerolineales bacterium]
MNKSLLSGLLVLIFSTLACRPVIAIGWNEFLLLFVLIAVLLGPSLYRFIRWVEKFLKQ